MFKTFVANLLKKGTDTWMEINKLQWFRNVIGPHPVLRISPKNSTLFTRLFLTGRFMQAGHKTSIEIPGANLLPHSIEMCLCTLTVDHDIVPPQCMKSDWGLWIRPMLMWNGDWDHTWTQPENALLSVLITHSSCSVVTAHRIWRPKLICVEPIQIQL